MAKNITLTDILKALILLIRSVSDGCEVYIGEMPQAFTRPSFLIETDGHQYNPDYTAQSAANTLYLTVTCFGHLTDGYRTEDQLELLELRDKVLGLFAAGRLAVYDRSLRCSVSSGGEIEGEAYLELTLEWLSDARIRDESGIPLMMELHTRCVRKDDRDGME